MDAQFDPMQGFKKSWKYYLASTAAWAITFGFMAITTYGGFMIHYGLGVLVIGYHLQNMAGAANTVTLALLRRDMQAHMLKVQSTLFGSDGLGGGGAYDPRAAAEQQIEAELRRIHANGRAH